MALKIFYTTDNHVGCNELDPVRGDDAINSFEEAMQIASAEKCDLVLQGGDLFHVNKPSKRSMYQVMRVLRQACFGDNPIQFEVLNDVDYVPRNIPESLNHVNFEDPNFNVGLPLFAISGNHDDAGGSAARDDLLSPLDILSVSGLINHIGRVYDNTQIYIKPVLIEKYGVKCAIYGMANVKDERLYRTFCSGGVHFLKPDTEDADTFYNILMLHQNHNKFGPKNYLPEQFIPDFIDLVLWGHEHESIIDPVWNEAKQFYVVQPGSSVATSLSPSELGPRYTLSITIESDKRVTFTKHMLKTARPFLFRSICLSTDAPDSIKPMKVDTRAKVTEFLISQVEEMLAEADKQWDATHSSDAPKMLPLIRLRVDYSGGYELENITRFSNRFLGRVANSNDVLALNRGRSRFSDTLDASLNPTHKNTVLHENAVEASSKLVPLLLKESLNADNLEILHPPGMVDALQRYVEKDEKLAIKSQVDDFVKVHVRELESSIQNLNVSDGGINRLGATSASGSPGDDASDFDDGIVLEKPNMNDNFSVPSKRLSVHQSQAASKRQAVGRNRAAASSSSSTTSKQTTAEKGPRAASQIAPQKANEKAAQNPAPSRAPRVRAQRRTRPSIFVESDEDEDGDTNRSGSREVEESEDEYHEKNTPPVTSNVTSNGQAVPQFVSFGDDDFDGMMFSGSD